MDDYHVQELNALMKGQETGGGCLGLRRMCHSCIVSERKRTGITYASGHRMLQGDRSLMNCQACFFLLTVLIADGISVIRKNTDHDTCVEEYVGERTARADETATANWASAKLWRRSHLREKDAESQGFWAVVFDVILKGLKVQMIDDGSLHTVEAFASGPISGVPWMTQEVGEEFWDLVNGDYVEGKTVRAASGMGRGAAVAVHALLGKVTHVLVVPRQYRSDTGQQSSP